MRSKTRRKKIKVNKVRIVLTVIIIILIAVVGVSVKNVFDLRAEQKELKENNRELLEKRAALKEELKNINDYGYIEEQARIQLRLIKPGEILYIMDPEGNKDKDSEDHNDGETE